MRGTIDFSEFSGRDKFETQYLGLSVQVMLIDIKSSICFSHFLPTPLAVLMLEEVPRSYCNTSFCNQ